MLSPLLFSAFINTITNDLSSSYYLYADDPQIYTSASLVKLVDGVNTINAALHKINKYSNSDGLNINPSKIQVIVVGSSRVIAKIDWTIWGFTSPNSSTNPSLSKQYDFGTPYHSQLDV